MADLPSSITRLVDLSGRVAIVTGGSRGIGRAIAQGYAAAGAHVVVTSRKADNCDEVAGAIEAAGGSALSVPAHVGRAEDRQRIVDETVAHFGAIDIVVNNAATALGVMWDDMTEAAFDKVFEVNTKPAIFLTKAAQPHLERSDQASVINVVSVGAFRGSDGPTMLYVASKAAVVSLTRGMAKLLAPKGIRVNALAPGPFDTDMMASMGPGATKSLTAISPMGRVASTDEIIGAALLLAGPGGSYMTGSATIVDGGFIA